MITGIFVATMIGLFFGLAVIIALELARIYKRNKDRIHKIPKVKYKRVTNIDGVFWYRQQDLKPEIKKYPGFYSFSHNYYNEILGKHALND